MPWNDPGTIGFDYEADTRWPAEDTPRFRP